MIRSTRLAAGGATPDITLPMLTVAEVADLLRVSQRTARRLIAGQDLQSCRVGRSVRVPQAAYLKLLQRGQ